MADAGEQAPRQRVFETLVEFLSTLHEIIMNATANRKLELAVCVVLSKLWSMRE